MDKKVVSVVAGVVCLSALPAPADAAVRISEIAWMGSEESSSAEWVELLNTDTAPVPLSGWTFSIVGKKDIPLSGEIPGKGLYVIARTNEFAPSTANIATSFGSGISNDGATLTLTDNASTTVDSINASGGWSPFGGNNTTKETAQLLVDCDRWNTAEPTPGSPAEGSCSSFTNQTTKATPTLASLYVAVGDDRTISTHDFLQTDAIVYDDDANIVSDGSIDWAFGDGSQDFGHHPSHVYQYPGEYIVAVRVHKNYQKTKASFIVTVDDADIRLAENSVRGIGIYNGDTRTVSLSGWKLQLGEAEYKIPEGTQILPGRTVIFPTIITKLTVPSDQVGLLYPDGGIATTFTQTLAMRSF